MRKFEGKLDRRGLDARLHATVLLLDEKELALRHARGPQMNNFFGATNVAPPTITFSDVHLAAIKFAERTNLFAVGEPLRAWKANGPLGEQLLRGVGMSAPVKGKPVPIASDFMELPLTAEARIRSSLDTYYLPAKVRAVSRPEEVLAPAVLCPLPSTVGAQVILTLVYLYRDNLNEIYRVELAVDGGLFRVGLAV